MPESFHELTDKLMMCNNFDGGSISALDIDSMRFFFSFVRRFWIKGKLEMDFLLLARLHTSVTS